MTKQNLTNTRTNPGRLELLQDNKGIWGFGWMGKASNQIVSYRADHRFESNYESLLFGELPPYDWETYHRRCCGEHAVCTEMLDDLMEQAGFSRISRESEAEEKGCLKLFQTNAERAVNQVNSLIREALDACANREALAVARQFGACCANLYYSVVENGPAVKHLIEIFPVAAYVVFGACGGDYRNYVLSACVCELFEELRDDCNCKEHVEQLNRAIEMAKEGTTPQALAEVLELPLCLTKVLPGNCEAVRVYINRCEPETDTEELLKEMPTSDPEQQHWLQDQLAEQGRQFEEELAERKRELGEQWGDSETLDELKRRITQVKQRPSEDGSPE